MSVTLQLVARCRMQSQSVGISCESGASAACVHETSQLIQNLLMGLYSLNVQCSANSTVFIGLSKFSRVLDESA